VNSIYREFVKRGLKPVVECDYMPKGLTGRELEISAIDSIKSIEI
jgi:hypothetical protein